MLISWQAAANGSYWLNIEVGGLDLTWLVDSGLVDPLDRVGFEVEPAIYDQLLWGGRFKRFQSRYYRTATGQMRKTESGLTNTQLIDPVSRQRVGPVAEVLVSRAQPGTPNRAGVVFFHRLVGLTVCWDLHQRTWSIDVP
jgi:hypothetical protein